MEPDGPKLVLTRTIAEPLVVTQTLSLEEERLIIVVAMSAGKAGPFTLTYERKWAPEGRRANLTSPSILANILRS